MQVTPQQRAAFDEMQSIRKTTGAAPFQNPNAQRMSDTSSSVQSVGGVRVGEFDAKVQQAEAEGKLTPAQASQLRSQVDQLGVNGVNNNISGASAAVDQQSERVVGDLPNLVSATQAYGNVHAAMATSPVPSDPPSPPSVCDGIEDLMGSIGGFATDIFDGIASGFGVVIDALSGVAQWIKDKFNLVVDWLGDLLSGSSPDSTSNPTQFNLNFSAALQRLSDFLSGIGQAVIDAFKGLFDGISLGLSSLTDKINIELGKIDSVYDTLKDAASVLSFPSLSPCAKDLIKLAAGAGGAVALVSLLD